MLDDRLILINKKVFELSSQVKILGPLGWPQSAEDTFLQGWKQGKVVFPEIRYKKTDYSEVISELEKILPEISGGTPAERITRRAAVSGIQAARMVSSVGTEAFTGYSTEIYGKPGDLMPGTSVTNIHAAKHFVEIANKFTALAKDSTYEVCFSSQVMKKHLEKNIVECFQNNGPTVEVVDGLMSKATAGGKRVRIRGNTSYSEYDLDQLLMHEVFIHSLTSINGYSQGLKCLAVGPPRTTKAQEGLATFSELISGTIDLARLKRIALRVLAVDMALAGANFVEVFKFFLEQDQSEQESYRSTARVFRGGFPDKQIVFTKDSVYLDGMIKVHTFFLWAMQSHRVDYLQALFCGRMALEDIPLLVVLLKNGGVAPPKFLPPWFRKIHGLGGILAFSLLANDISIDDADSYFTSQAES